MNKRKRGATRTKVTVSQSKYNIDRNIPAEPPESFLKSEADIIEENLDAVVKELVPMPCRESILRKNIRAIKDQMLQVVPYSKTWCEFDEELKIKNAELDKLK